MAGEVRSLAQRSADAAKEIKALITQSGDRVETGARLVAEAGSSMDEIVAQVRRVNDLIAEISAASREQSSGIGQIGEAVSQLDQVTQQNAALVEEMAAAADSLKNQAAHDTGGGGVPRGRERPRAVGDRAPRRGDDAAADATAQPATAGRRARGGAVHRACAATEDHQREGDGRGRLGGVLNGAAQARVKRSPPSTSRISPVVLAAPTPSHQAAWAMSSGWMMSASAARCL